VEVGRGRSHSRRGRRCLLTDPQAMTVSVVGTTAGDGAEQARRPAFRCAVKGGRSALRPRTLASDEQRSSGERAAAMRLLPRVQSPKGGDAVVVVRSIRTRNPDRVLVTPTSLRYLRDTSPRNDRRRTRLLQGFQPEFEGFARLCENRGVSGSSPGSWFRAFGAIAVGTVAEPSTTSTACS
jgi:hypothetical protein